MTKPQTKLTFENRDETTNIHSNKTFKHPKELLFMLEMISWVLQGLPQTNKKRMFLSKLKLRAVSNYINSWWEQSYITAKNKTSLAQEVIVRTILQVVGMNPIQSKNFLFSYFIKKKGGKPDTTCTCHGASLESQTINPSQSRSEIG